jgi:hypothetical protein
MDDWVGVDMSEATGEASQNAAGEPAAPHPRPAVTNPRAAAWGEYQAHRNGCPQCMTSVWRCAQGNELWNAYLGC